MLTAEQLNKYWNVAVRDDACDLIVPSDIRLLVGECLRLRAYVNALDKKFICSRGEGDTFIDEGMIVASDVVG